MILSTRMAPLPRSLADTAALFLVGALASLLVPSAHAQTADSALAPSNLTAELVDSHVSLDWDAPAEDGVYTWRDGDRIMMVRLEPGEGGQKSPAVGDGKGVRTVERSKGNTEPVFRSESGGGLMTLPGGVLLVLDSSWTGSDADAFFSRNGIKRSRGSELTLTKNAYFVETAPGLSSETGLGFIRKWAPWVTKMVSG